MSAKDDLLDALPDEPVFREIKPVQSTDMVIAESRHVVFYIRLNPGQQLEDALCADFYRLVAHRLVPSTIIEIEPADLSWHAQILVREVSREHARVALLHKVDLEPLYAANVDDIPLGHSVQFLGPARLFAAMHGTAILKHSFSTRGEAIAWLQTLR